jgi:hypothetical protein
MPTQLRTYTLHPNALEAFVGVWQAQIKPLREKLGFRILGAWTIKATNQFVWLLHHDDANAWQQLDQAYFDSEERRAMQPDPASLIARMEHHFVEPIT